MAVVTKSVLVAEEKKEGEKVDGVSTFINVVQSSATLSTLPLGQPSRRRPSCSLASFGACLLLGSSNC
jgi:hypothetical protein